MASSVVLEELSADGLFAFLLSKGIPQTVLDNFEKHSIDGDTFVCMSDEQLKEVAEKIVDRVKLKKIMESVTSTEKENRAVNISNQSTTPTVKLKADSLCSLALNTPSHNWHYTFQIPSAFSLQTEEALATGQITRRVRTEIILALSASIMVHTRNPSSDQYNTVCRKLIETYPNLKDEIGSTGYGSWKTKLRDRFKFLRHPSALKTDSETADPSPKRQKTSKRLGNGTSASSHYLDDDSLTTKLATLQDECSKWKKDRSLAKIHSLTTDVQPPVVEILELPIIKNSNIF